MIPLLVKTGRTMTIVTDIKKNDQHFKGKDYTDVTEYKLDDFKIAQE